MQHIGSALKNFIKGSGLEKGLNQQMAIEVWPEIVGKTITKNTEAISIEYGVLKVQTKTPAWRQELQLQKIEIISKLNKKLNKKIIKDIRFI